MNKRTETLFWNGKIVGVISNPKLVNFDYYGSWTPITDTDLYRQFLEQVDMEGGARFEIGDVGSPLTGTVELEPGDEIDVKIRISATKS